MMDLWAPVLELAGSDASLSPVTGHLFLFWPFLPEAIEAPAQVGCFVRDRVRPSNLEGSAAS